MNSFNYDDHENKDESETFGMIAQLFVEAEYSKGYQRSRNVQDAFIWWLQGLPYNLSDYYLHSAVELVGDWLEQTQTERKKYSEQEAERLASYLIFREISPYIYNLL